MKAAVSVPVTIKLRLGWSAEKPTFLKIARAAEQAGVDAVTLHPRSRAQRYRRPADWSRIAELVDAVTVPVIGNGDILSWRDASRRAAESGCTAVMVGRWALAKPWIFREFADLARRTRPRGPNERLAVLRRYVELCREHFGDDASRAARGIRRFSRLSSGFLPPLSSRFAGGDAVNSDDPQGMGATPPADDLERLAVPGPTCRRPPKRFVRLAGGRRARPRSARRAGDRMRQRAVKVAVLRLIPRAAEPAGCALDER